MKQKTQMQYLIDELIDIAKKEDKIGINLVIGMACVRLEKEKQQIIEAFTKGNRQEYYDGSEESGLTYYNETFKQE